MNWRVAAYLLMACNVFLGWRIGEAARVANENRRLIAQVEANYAANADFRQLVERSAR